MKSIHLQCSQQQTAAYLIQALNVSLQHNPGTTFTLTCDRPWHAALADFVADSRISLTTDSFLRACDVDILFGKQLRGMYQSIPRMFVGVFREIAGGLDFVSGLNSEHDLLFNTVKRNAGTPARVLFINEPNPMMISDQMDTLIQSIVDRRLSVITTSPSKARHSVWQDGRNISDYAYIASQCDNIVGVAGAHMAVSFNRQSVNTVRGWFVIDPKHTYPFNDHCFHAASWQKAVELLRQHEIL